MNRGRWWVDLVWAAAYAAAVVAGRQLVLPHTGLALFWPAAGLAALWIGSALSRGRLWPAAFLVVAATAGVNTGFGVPLGAAAVFGVANLVQGLVYAACAGGGARQTGVARLWKVGWASLLASCASAAPGLLAAGLNDGDVTASSVLSWVVRNACGTFVVVTLALAHRQAWRPGRALSARDLLTSRRRPAAAVEYAAAVLTTTLVAVYVFGRVDPLPLSFVVLATSVWVGSRFSPVVAATHSTLLGVAVVFMTLAGNGPIGAIAELDQRALVVQLFVLLNSGLTQLLSVGLRDRHELLERALASESDARRQRATLEAVLETMHDGLVVVDGSGRFLVRNSAALRMSPTEDQGVDAGLRSAAAYGLTELDGEVIAPHDMPSARALSGRHVANRLLLRVSPDEGRRAVLSVNASPLLLTDDDGGDVPVAVMNMTDVTELHAQLAELEGFAGVVAHDLRNPIAAVMSWAEVADEQLEELDVDASQVRRSLVRVYSTAARAMELTTELLDYARSGNQPLELDDVELDGLMDEVVVAASPPGAPVDVQYADLGRVRADRALLRQLLVNLVGNAVKYVAPGVVPSVHVDARVTDTATVLEVADNGIGIAPEHRRRVFETFYRAPTRSSFAGTGLGLAICARVVERHGGEITAHENRATGGTVVRVSLPRSAPASLHGLQDRDGEVQDPGSLLDDHVSPAELP